MNKTSILSSSTLSRLLFHSTRKLTSTYTSPTPYLIFSQLRAMSDSESAFGDEASSGSDAYVVPKKTVKGTATTASKKPKLPEPVKKAKVCMILTRVKADDQAPAVKKTSAPKQPLAIRKNPPNNSLSEQEDSDDQAAPSTTGKDNTVNAIATSSGKGPAKDASDMYQKVSCTVSERGLMNSSRNWNTF